MFRILFLFTNYPEAEMTNLTWPGFVMASAADNGEIAQNQAAKQQTFELGKNAATP